MVTWRLDGAGVPASGSKVLQLTESRALSLKAHYGGLVKELDTVQVTVAEPQVQLPGLYQGTINADFGSVANLTAQVIGANSALTATLTIAPGARVDCHGDRLLGGRTLGLTGHRTGVNLDGSSTYAFSGSFEFESSVHVVVDVTVNGATLSADGSTFAGTANLLIKPDYVSNCTRSWPFTATRVMATPVPSVLDMTVAQARSTLSAAGLQANVTTALDSACSTLPGRIMRQNPRPEPPSCPALW